MAEIRRQFETNVFGLMRLTQLALPGMRRQRWGKIVNLSSMGGKLTLPGGAFYHATKHAVEALSDALRFEVRGFGIDVIVIEPGPSRPASATRRSRASTRPRPATRRTPRSTPSSRRRSRKPTRARWAASPPAPRRSPGDREGHHRPTPGSPLPGDGGRAHPAWDCAACYRTARSTPSCARSSRRRILGIAAGAGGLPRGFGWARAQRARREAPPQGPEPARKAPRPRTDVAHRGPSDVSARSTAAARDSPTGFGKTIAIVAPAIWYARSRSRQCAGSPTSVTASAIASLTAASAARDVARLHRGADRVHLVLEAALREHVAVEGQVRVARQHALRLVEAGRAIGTEVRGREVADLERLRVAAGALRAAVQHRHRAAVAFEREEVEDDAVGQLARELDHGSARAPPPGSSAACCGTRLVWSLHPGRAQRADDLAHLRQRVAHLDAERRVDRAGARRRVRAAAARRRTPAPPPPAARAASGWRR